VQSGVDWALATSVEKAVSRAEATHKCLRNLYFIYALLRSPSFFSTECRSSCFFCFRALQTSEIAGLHSRAACTHESNHVDTRKGGVRALYCSNVSVTRPIGAVEW
jgi:hypothetical protein